ncbi:MAG: hypothetical protein ABI304_08835 [Rudaea sp.]
MMRHQQIFGLILVAVLALAAGYLFGVYRARTNPLADQAQQVAVKDVPHSQPIMKSAASTHMAQTTRLQSHPIGVSAPLPPDRTPLAKSYAQLKATNRRWIAISDRTSVACLACWIIPSG